MIMNLNMNNILNENTVGIIIRSSLNRNVTVSKKLEDE
jgi:hypothetical protein